MVGAAEAGLPPPPPDDPLGAGAGFDPPPVVGAAEAGFPPPPDDDPLGAGAGIDPEEPLGVGGAGTGLHDGAAAELPVVEYPPG